MFVPTILHAALVACDAPPSTAALRDLVSERLGRDVCHDQVRQVLTRMARAKMVTSLDPLPGSLSRRWMLASGETAAYQRYDSAESRG